ncbi:MAG: glycerol-3-phosphate 1-O-acyltransferase PlsY [Clostridiales bacterium]|nr:glycerol-3-phosphate 1-O-acyltransferase PlsY [Clostridiales bacterium]MCF8023233.1 glycerol-3-phosphate 1-O-acyltransferase PlsY [Clostridiales bacterium]
MHFLIAVVISYLIGSVPVGFIVSRLKGVDIRQYGSGNIGTTNVWRSLGPVPGLLTFLGDTAKGAVSVFIGLKAGGQGIELLCGIAAILGHSWPVYLRFKGGKIIATGLGVLAALSCKTALLAVLVWLVTVGVSRYISLGSILAALSVPCWMYLFQLERMYFLFGILTAFFAVIKHRSNIVRLFSGKEFKIGNNNKKDE